ncbi:hypothetical protein QAD02_020420 [Eretmocerus hayati]|uniref:Uncharacterized protein n=1 Tax=Eretmocerus hayati TaxID=131215 RepID=A0ACC2PQK6_9HYME|nr:hypothetical protein QAD02_020420 [Eretmocerus hayati]
MYHRSELRQTRDIDLLSRAFSWLLFSCPIRDLPRYHRRFFPSNKIAILAAGEIVRRRDMEHLPALNHLMEEYREMQVQPRSPGERNPITTESSGSDIHELQNSLPAETSSIPCAQSRESSHTETQRQPQESQPSDIATNDSSPGALLSTQSGGGLGAPASANDAANKDIDLQVRPAGVRFTVVGAGPRYVRRFRINGRRLALRILPPPQGTLNPILWLENGKLGDRIIYVDTDCTIFKYSENAENAEYEPPLGSLLGDMTDELAVYGPDFYIDTFISIAPKSYAYRAVTSSGQSYECC